jgi:transposase
MDNIGLDLHKRETQVCILSLTGALGLERRIPTTRPALTALLSPREPARCLREASTESEWVAQHLEQLGHEVIVADPNYAPMYATRHRAVKTDRRDGHSLAEACRLGAYRVVHRPSAGSRAGTSRPTQTSRSPATSRWRRPRGAGSYSSAFRSSRIALLTRA